MFGILTERGPAVLMRWGAGRGHRTATHLCNPEMVCVLTDMNATKNVQALQGHGGTK